MRTYIPVPHALKSRPSYLCVFGCSHRSIVFKNRILPKHYEDGVCQRWCLKSETIVILSYTCYPEFKCIHTMQIFLSNLIFTNAFRSPINDPKLHAHVSLHNFTIGCSECFHIAVWCKSHSSSLLLSLLTCLDTPSIGQCYYRRRLIVIHLLVPWHDYLA